MENETDENIVGLSKRHASCLKKDNEKNEKTDAGKGYDNKGPDPGNHPICLAKRKFLIKMSKRSRRERRCGWEAQHQ